MKRNRNKNNTRVAQNAITVSYELDFTEGKSIRLGSSAVIQQVFGGNAFVGYISSLILDPKDVESVE
jgi:hypothetical protein